MYVVGNAASNLYGRHQGGGLDAFVARYDASGHLLWGRQFGTSAFDSATAVGTDAWDNVYVVGTTTGNLAGSRGGYDAFLRKYTPNGEVVWTRQLGGSGSDSIQDLAVDAGGNVYLQQSLNSQLGVAKYSPDGVRLWTRHAGASTCNGSLAVSENGDVYTASFVGDGTGTTLCLNRMTANGGILWVQYVRYEARFYGGASFSGARVAASGNHVYVTGANGPAGNNDSNIFVAHFDALSPQQPTWQYTNLGLGQRERRGRGRKRRVYRRITAPTSTATAASSPNSARTGAGRGSGRSTVPAPPASPAPTVSRSPPAPPGPAARCTPPGTASRTSAPGTGETATSSCAASTAPPAAPPGPDDLRGGALEAPGAAPRRTSAQPSSSSRTGPRRRTPSRPPAAREAPSLLPAEAGDPPGPRATT